MCSSLSFFELKKVRKTQKFVFISFIQVGGVWSFTCLIMNFHMERTASSFPFLNTLRYFCEVF